MTLKVIRYKNYGCQMTSEDDNHKFYFSFHELNNGEIIELMLFQSDDDDSIAQCDLYYTKFKLKSGEIIDYNFGNAKAKNENEMSKEFFDWFDSCPPAKDVINNTTPNKNEEKCVKDFYLKHIEPTKDVKTNTIEV